MPRHTVIRHDDPPAFAARVRPMLLERECENCFLVGVTGEYLTPGGARDGGSPPTPSSLLVSIEGADGTIVGAGVQTRPIGMAVSRLADPAPVEALVDHLHATGWPGTGFVAPAATADALADGWAARVGRAKRLLVDLRLFQLTEVVQPDRPAPGRMVPAAQQHLDVLAPWHDAFGREIGQPTDDPRGDAARAIEEGRLFVWADERNAARAMAATAGPTPNGIRINRVYTPPEFRGHGYASSLVAALSARMLKSGRRFCFLFTDAANSTSNKIYHRIGYTPVCAFRHWVFEGGVER